MIFSIDQAQDNLEELLAMALNGETVLISSSGELFKLDAVKEAVTPGKVYTVEDFFN